MVIIRERKSKFVRLFDKTPIMVKCPHFYELILSNGCPYDCSYCYLKLTFRGETQPTLFENGWDNVKKELDDIPQGVFSTGELADSLAIVPPLLPKALDYFSNQKGRYILLVTKSTNVEVLRKKNPSDSVILSFSVNSPKVSHDFEKDAPSPINRLKIAKEMIKEGWRIRIRLDPIILETGLEGYKSICEEIIKVHPERITVGTLRQYPTLKNYAVNAPSRGLKISKDGRMRYSIDDRIMIYTKIKSWLGQQPSLCKETHELWDMLGWEFRGCNCTV